MRSARRQLAWNSGPAASPARLVVGPEVHSPHQTLPVGPLSDSWSPTTQGHIRDQRALSLGMGMGGSGVQARPLPT